MAHTKAFARHFFCVGLFILSTALASTSACAADPAPPNAAEFYVNKYAEQFAQLQEVSFSFTGYITRSTPSKGLAARWKDSGTIRVSANRKSYYFSGVTTATFPLESKELGVRELLVTPEGFLDLVIHEDSVQVGSKKVIIGNEWAAEAARYPIGMFLGYAPAGFDDDSLSAVIRSHVREFLPNEILDSKSLRGFLVRADDSEIRVLFDSLIPAMPTQISVSRLAEKIEVNEVQTATLNLLDVKYHDSKPSFVKLRIRIERTGGTVKNQTDIPGVELVDKREVIKLEPETWEYGYELTDILYREAPDDAWFKLHHSIPNGSFVILDDDFRSPRIWKDGKIQLPKAAP